MPRLDDRHCSRRQSSVFKEKQTDTTTTTTAAAALTITTNDKGSKRTQALLAVSSASHWCRRLSFWRSHARCFTIVLTVVLPLVLSAFLSLSRTATHRNKPEGQTDRQSVARGKVITHVAHKCVRMNAPFGTILFCFLISAHGTRLVCLLRTLCPCF